MANDNGRFFRVCLCLFDGFGKRVHVIGACNEVHVQHLPILCRKTRAYVFTEGNVRVPFNRDFIIIIEKDKFTEFVRACKGASFVGNPFLQTAVPANRVGVVVNHVEVGFVELSGKMRFGDRHTNGGWYGTCRSASCR